MKSEAQQKLDEKVARFYLSYDWRRIRYLVLKDYAGRCMLCNRDDPPLHVDHIKPLRKYWSLRLEYTNLQVLCEECNHGKGNWDETDWRPLSKKKIQRELDLAKAQDQFDRKRLYNQQEVKQKLTDAHFDDIMRRRKRRMETKYLHKRKR